VGLADAIRDTSPRPGEVALFSLGQAGFCVKTSGGTTLAIDPYLTDCVERLVGFKRLIPPPVRPEELEVELVAATHSHPDHLDVDAVAVWARRPRVHFVGAPDCAEPYRSCGVPAERVTILREGESYAYRDVRLRAVYADHGELAPEAVGYLVVADGVSLYDVGDSGFRPERLMASLGGPVDVMVAPACLRSTTATLTGSWRLRSGWRRRPGRW